MLNVYALKDSCFLGELIYGRQCTVRDYSGFNAAMVVMGLANVLLGIIFIKALRMSLSEVQKIILNETQDSSSNHVPIIEQQTITNHVFE